LSIHETVRIDEHRRCQAVTVEQVMRATRDGARRITVVPSPPTTAGSARCAGCLSCGPSSRTWSSAGPWSGTRRP
jgi:hypothetical protein